MIIDIDIYGWILELDVYLLIGIMIVMITTLASVYHKKYEPAVWGWVIGTGIYLAQNYIETLLLGWYTMEVSLLFYISLSYFLMWIASILILLANTIKKGEVVL